MEHLLKKRHKNVYNEKIKIVDTFIICIYFFCRRKQHRQLIPSSFSQVLISPTLDKRERERERDEKRNALKDDILLRI